MTSSVEAAVPGLAPPEDPSGQPPGPPPEQALVVFSSRESGELLHANLMALSEAVAASGARAEVVVLVNGNASLVDDLLARLREAPPPYAVSLWRIPFGDKANAWNQYVHAIWRGERLAFFIDGYVTLPREAMPRLAAAVAAGGDHVLGGTGVPSVGREARALREQLLRDGGYHGNFCCLKGETVAAMRDRGLRLPVGLYRTDSLMGALLSFGLHPEQGRWDPSHIAVCADATWQLPPKQWWRWSDLKGQFKRLLRQGKGRVENAAVKFFLATRRQRFERLPTTARALVADWRAQAPVESEALLRAGVLNRRGFRELVAQADPVAGDLLPRLIWRGEATTRA